MEGVQELSLRTVATNKEVFVRFMSLWGKQTLAIAIMQLLLCENAIKGILYFSKDLLRGLFLEGGYIGSGF